MPQSIFWSWQSDRPARETRNVIREALSEALRDLSADLADAGRPEDQNDLVLDHDTRGLPGSPDIAAEILRKIEGASVFVADVTPIAVVPANRQRTRRRKHLPNSNVLIELGYAKSAIGTERIVQVWNTAFTNSTPDDLPFDMRGRRGPISFRLVEGASKEELRRVRGDLTRQLKHAIALALEADDGGDSTVELPWKPSRSDDQSVWFAIGEVQLASTSIGGTRRVSFLEGPRGYARLIPTFPSHSDDTVEKLAGDTGHPMFFGMSGGIWYGPAAHGFLVFPALPDQNTPVHGATKWFDDNGEFWGFSTGFFYEEQDGRIGLAYTRLVGFWKSFLSRHARLSAAHGAQGPYNFRVGLTSLAGTVWPRSAYDFDDPRREALIDKVEFAGQFSKPEPDILGPLLRTAINKVRAAYGLSSVSDDGFAKLMLEN